MRAPLWFVTMTSCAAVALAQTSQQLVGFSSERTSKQRTIEADALRRPTPASAETHARALTSRAHVSGTSGQAWTRDYVADRFREWGIPTTIQSFSIWMPHATSVRAWRTNPDPIELDLAEGAVAEDTTSHVTPQVLTVNGYSAAGDVTAEVVYVNYGLIEDYRLLDSLNISVEGKIAIARYGKSFRGIKAREAEKQGAAGLIIYSDPADDGYVKGDIYPDGPMRPPHGVQRGSILNAAGDPSTPGYPSSANASRISREAMEVPRIPVIAMSYGNAAALLRGTRGGNVPDSWQGGLDFRYHIGPGPVTARITVTNDESTHPYKQIWNVIGEIRGAEKPEEIIVIGGHRDAWGPGAADNVSGTVSVLETARAIAEQVKAGMRPRRTILFALWDAEEWGLIGSTEFVEQDSLRLARHAVAYLNQDMVAYGPRFGAGGSPSLRSTIRNVVKGIDDPSGRGTVYEVWRKAANLQADSLEPVMSDPGGGSDFAGFYNHLGIPHGQWGYSGSSGIYHSVYDSYHWMAKFGDPGFKYHATVGRISAVMTLRLANADILPFDYVEFARTVRGFIVPVQRAVMHKGWQVSVDSLRQATDRMERAAIEFASARDSVLQGAPTRNQLDQCNTALLRVERALTRAEGLRTRPWYRNLIYASDENNGYSTMTLPSVNEAIRDGDAARATREIADLVAHLDLATRAIADARAAISRR
jgi:N-acetylated-alpha-linked acidic dipeptidase